MKYSKLILCKKDHDLLRVILNNWNLNTELSKVNYYLLSYELQKAKIVDAKNLPLDIVKLHSFVDIETPYGLLENYQLVEPSERNPSNKKLSLSSPVGSAIIGYAKGDEIKWHFPVGERTIKIVRVKNEDLENSLL